MKKRIKSFGYAGRGIGLVISNEANMKIHLAVALLVLMAGFYFQISVPEWLACLFCFGLVFTAEMMNTAIENVIDLFSPEQHELARNGKDIAAGAVLVSALIAAIVGLLIFLPKVWKLV